MTTMPVSARTPQHDKGASSTAKKADATGDPGPQVEAVAVAGLAFAEGQGKSKGALKRARQKANRQAAKAPFAPTAEERTALASEWGMAETDELFTAALTSRVTHDYVKALSPSQRAVVTPEEILGTVKVEAATWNERRRGRLDLLTDEDKAFMAARWGLAPDHTNVVWAMKEQANWAYARTLTAQQMPYITNKHKKARAAPPTESEIEATKKRLAEAEAKAKAEAAAKAKAAAAAAKKAEDAEKRAKGEAEWAVFREQLIAKVGAELSGLARETIVGLIGGTATKIEQNKQINIAAQMKTLGTSVDAAIAKEKKTREVETAARDYLWLKGLVVQDLKTAVMDDPTLTVDDFRQRADQARVRQRNLVGVADAHEAWARMLRLKIYKPGAAQPFESLSPQADLRTHYSIDLDGIRPPGGLSLATTADQLLDAVLQVALRHKRIHVTLETGVAAGPDQLKLPHRYWTGAGAADYDLYYDGGYERWDPETHSRSDVMDALDDAYDELRTRLLARAQVVLDRDCDV